MRPTYDLLIQRGTVFDGTGAPPRVADVAVRDGKIVEISTQPLQANNAASRSAPDSVPHPCARRSLRHALSSRPHVVPLIVAPPVL